MLVKPDSCSGCPLYEPPYGKHVGFSFPDGECLGGVAIVAEALGADEEIEGMALVGKSGYALFQNLARVDIHREQFRVLNTIFCRPPENKLVKQPYEQAAITHCSPNLDRELIVAKQMATRAGKTFTIVALGMTPWKRLLGMRPDDPRLKLDSYGYPFWSDQYEAWVLHCPHPAYLLRGKANLWPVLQFVFTRALEIANGFSLDQHRYDLDPDPRGFTGWTDEFLRVHGSNPEVLLSYDIETPYKVKKPEEELSREDDADHTILRCSFAYTPTGKVEDIRAGSIRWSAEYLSDIERLFGAGAILLGWNSDLYDKPRVSSHVQMKGLHLDAMIAWHVLNTSLPKSLGFVTPYYWQNVAMWKHLSDTQPALYNTIDSVAALRNYLGIREDLVKNRLWHVFERHVLQLNQALGYMSMKGLPRDNEMRQEAETRLSTMLNAIEERMEAVVPPEARKWQTAKKKPKLVEGWTETTAEYPVLYCRLCGLQKPGRWKKHSTVCPGVDTLSLMEPFAVWTRPLEFKVSKLGLTNYQKSLRHQAVISREKKVTFNEDAIVKLMKTYPNDPLYPLILNHRHYQKLLSTYVGITEYIPVEVPDDYILSPGEKWSDAL